MVHPLTPHILPKPRLYPQQLNPFLNLSDRPLTHLGHQLLLILFHGLSYVSYSLSLPDTLNPPWLHFDP